MNEDASDFATSLKDGVADVIFVDPPFNLGKDYGIRSSIETATAGEYEKYLRGLLDELVRALKPGGSLYLYHLPSWASRLAAHLHDHLTFQHWIAIAMKGSFARGRRLYPAHYALLFFSKGRAEHFHRPRLKPQVCRHCGQLVKDYGGYRSIIEEKGINLSDFWDDVSPVRHHKHREANELPRKITDRVMQISGTPGALLVDPFVGAGTSLVSAIAAEMNFVGNDLSRRSTDVARGRAMAALIDGTSL